MCVWETRNSSIYLEHRAPVGEMWEVTRKKTGAGSSLRALGAMLMDLNLWDVIKVF